MEGKNTWEGNLWDEIEENQPLEIFKSKGKH